MSAPDDEYLDAAEEFLAEQYDREIEEFYLEAREQARVKHGAGQHGQLEEQGPLENIIIDTTSQPWATYKSNSFIDIVRKRKHIPLVSGKMKK